MRHPLLWASVLAAAFISNAAFACGQVACDEPAAPGKKVDIRGYGYSFEGGDRPVTLRWNSDGFIAGSTQIDPQGNFLVQVVAPEAPGLHQLVVSVGERDPSPVVVTVPVLLPWYRQPLASLRATPVEVGAALAGLLLGASGLLAYRQRTRQRRGPAVAG